MKMGELGEFPFLRRLRERLPRTNHDKRIDLGVGDDCAALSLPGTTVVTTDAMIEGVHFKSEWMPSFMLGQKAFEVNASDVAAMGGRPAFALLSLGIPQEYEVSDLDAFFDGFLKASQNYGTTVIGGNMSSAPVLMISVSMLGDTPHGYVTRSGARTGDNIYVTGTLGDASIGLQILNGEVGEGVATADLERLKSRFLCPTSRVLAGLALVANSVVTAMIDISDGLLQDLTHICEASKVGASIDAKRIPVSSEYEAVMGPGELMDALVGGENCELLFCGAAEDHVQIQKISSQGKCSITRVGKVVPRSEGILVSHDKQIFPASHFRGFDHFVRESE